MGDMAGERALWKFSRSWWCSNEHSQRETLTRCRSKHIIEDALCLAEGPCKLPSNLFLILSHCGNHNVNAKLSTELESMGTSKVHVMYGFKCGRDYHDSGQSSY